MSSEGSPNSNNSGLALIKQSILGLFFDRTKSSCDNNLVTTNGSRSLVERATPLKAPRTKHARIGAEMIPITVANICRNHSRQEVQNASSDDHYTSSQSPFCRLSTNSKKSTFVPNGQLSDKSRPVPFEDPRIERFSVLLNKDDVDMDRLREMSWNGIPDKFRGLVWRLLLEYCPTSLSQRHIVMSRKRKDYRDMCTRYYADLSTNEFRSDWLRSASAQDKMIVHQIKIDVPRTLPHNVLFAQLPIQRALERVLIMWAFRHPASGYVQGINDLVTPFFVIFLKEILCNRQPSPSPPVDHSGENDFLVQSKSGGEKSLNSVILTNSGDSDGSGDALPKKRFMRRTEDFDIDLRLITEEDLALVEADSYWAVTKFIESIQDNYTFGQPGIQRMLHELEGLVLRIDAPLAAHLNEEGVQFVQFAFRWMNCLLMRELPLRIVIRMWDTYISEGYLFPSLHTYLCASLLIIFSKELCEFDFQGLMIFLHKLPTDTWTTDIIEPLLSQAYSWKIYYGESPSHLKNAL